jgi:hypothetical protein
MPSEPFLQPILEDVDLEAQHDNLLELETYKHFTSNDWFNCSKIVCFLFTILALLCLLLYIVFYSLKKY